MARLWEAFPDVQNFVDRMKTVVPRCLTSEQRERLFLSLTSPRALWLNKPLTRFARGIRRRN